MLASNLHCIELDTVSNYYLQSIEGQNKASKNINPTFKGEELSSISALLGGSCKSSVAFSAVAAAVGEVSTCRVKKLY